MKGGAGQNNGDNSGCPLDNLDRNITKGDNMKKILILLVSIILLTSSLFAVEPDNKVIFVPNGWTSEKQAMAQDWKDMSTQARQSAIANLETRLNNLIPSLPPDQFSAEKNEYVGYRIRLQKLYEKFQSNPSAWNYAEFAYLLKEAETYVWYINREKTLPKSEYEEAELPWNNGQSDERDEFRQGTGWDLGYVDMSTIDHLTPAVASYNNYVFVCAHNSTSGTGEDTMVLWRSTDYGKTWGKWHSHGTSTADRVPFDLAIDPVNQYLYEAYYIQTSTITGNIWLRRFTDFDDSTATNIYAIETTADQCGQPHLSVEHQYSEHRVCCMYYNAVTDNIVIAQSTDQGQTWSTVYTTSWTYTTWPRIKGAQGAVDAGTDKFVFVAKKSNNSLAIFESVSGLPGSWTETEYVHAQDIDAVDISASHNQNQASVVVAFGYPWSSTDYNVRILFRMEGGPGFVSTLVDGDGYMTMTPVITCDGEYAPNNTGPDYYHLSYYKDHDDDDYYIPFALRTLNDSSALVDMRNNDPTYFEVVGSNVIDTLVSSYDYGRPLAYYQIDMTTVWNNTHSQWFPAIAWMRYYTATNDADPRLSFSDENFGISEQNGEPITGITVKLAPNPSNDIAKLSYTLENQSDVRISIYDASGRLINSPVNEKKPAGTYSTIVDCKELASGIYFVRVEADNQTTTKSMTIVR